MKRSFPVSLIVWPLLMPVLFACTTAPSSEQSENYLFHNEHYPRRPAGLEFKEMTENNLRDALAAEVDKAFTTDSKIASGEEMIAILRRMSPKNNYSSSTAGAVLASTVHIGGKDFTVMSLARALVLGSQKVEALEEDEKNQSLVLDNEALERLTLVGASNSIFLSGLVLVVDKLKSFDSLEGQIILQLLVDGTKAAQGNLDPILVRRNMVRMQSLTNFLLSEQAVTSEDAFRLLKEQIQKQVVLKSVVNVTADGTLSFSWGQGQERTQYLTVQPDANVAEEPQSEIDLAPIGENDLSDPVVVIISERQALSATTSLYLSNKGADGKVHLDSLGRNLGDTFRFQGRAYEISNSGSHRVEKVSAGVVALKCQMKVGLTNFFSHAVDEEYILIIDVSKPSPEVQMVIKSEIEDDSIHHNVTSDGQRLYVAYGNWLMAYDLKSGALLGKHYFSGGYEFLEGALIGGLPQAELAPLVQPKMNFRRNFNLSAVQTQNGKLKLFGTDRRGRPVSYTVSGNAIFPSVP